MNWISVKDRLPNDKDVIFIFCDGSIIEGTWNAQGYMKDRSCCGISGYLPEVDFHYWILEEDIPMPGQK